MERGGRVKAVQLQGHGYRKDRGRVAAVGDTDHLAHPSQKSASPWSRRFLWGTVGPHVPWGGHTDSPSPRETLGYVMRTRTLTTWGRPTALGDTTGHRGDPCGASAGAVVGMEQTSI